MEKRKRAVKFKIKKRDNTIFKQIGFFLLILLISISVLYLLNSYFHLISFTKETGKMNPIVNPNNGDKTANQPSGSNNQTEGNDYYNNSGEGGAGGGGKKSGGGEESSQDQNRTREIEYNRTIFLASWDLYPLDDTKELNSGIMQAYAAIISSYDIIFIQGITSPDAFTSLCALLPNYDCFASSLSGRSTEKQGYGVIYKKGNLSLVEWKDYNPDSQDRWERPPFEVQFKFSSTQSLGLDYLFRIYSLKTNQNDAEGELSSLEGIVAENGNMVVLGNLNADCSYYDPAERAAFADWRWVVTDTADTAVSSENCAYDRIILNSEAYSEFMPYETGNGVYNAGITEALSDHYLVWAEIRPEEQS